VTPAIDEQIAQLAVRQNGNVTHRQLLTLGLGRAAIAYRARTGRLHREHLGVYGVGRPARTALERASAAVLACGPGAALSHQSAFTLWGFADRWRDPVHVSAPTQRRRPGIVTHHTPSLARRDVRTQLGIRVTSPARTVLDCAPDLTPPRLLRAIADGRRSGHLKAAALQDVLDRFPTHPGRAPLAAACKTAQPTRSEFEDAFLVFCERHGLPTPTVNTHVCGHEVDALFEDHHLIVELDGWDFHRDRHSFEDDRDRDADTLAAGYATVRITWERMHQTPAREAARLQAILARRAG
jgi:very-short-patch-repair endonuclease